MLRKRKGRPLLPRAITILFGLLDPEVIPFLNPIIGLRLNLHPFLTTVMVISLLKDKVYSALSPLIHVYL